MVQQVTSGIKISVETTFEGTFYKNYKVHFAFGYKVTIEGLSRSFDKTFWNYAKLISGILRHGMPLYQAVELISNLTFDTESINTWKNGVVRSLKKYIPDGTTAAKNKCPECDAAEGLVYKEGCLTCKHCGYSKCG